MLDKYIPHMRNSNLEIRIAICSGRLQQPKKIVTYEVSKAVYSWTKWVWYFLMPEKHNYSGESSHYLHGNTHIALDFLKVLYFFLVGYAILKDFWYLFGAKFTGRKFHR